MRSEKRFILYVGGIDRGNALKKVVDPYGWDVKIIMERNRVLAVYVFCFPDIVIIEDSAKTAGLVPFVLCHLISMGARPFIILSDDPVFEKKQIPDKATGCVLPGTTHIGKIVEIISKLTR